MKVDSNNRLALISVIMVLIAVVSFVFAPIAVPILTLLALVTAWRSRVLTEPHTGARNLANTALLLSILLIVVEIGIYLSFFVTHSSFEKVSVQSGRIPGRNN